MTSGTHLVSVAALIYPITSLLSCIGRETHPEVSRSSTKRYTEQQLARFIDFIQSPHIVTDMPFGERTIKLSSGKTLLYWMNGWKKTERKNIERKNVESRGATFHILL